MPTVFAEDTIVKPLVRPLSGAASRPGSSSASRPGSSGNSRSTTPGSSLPNLKGCLKTHARAHSAAAAKRARFSEPLIAGKSGTGGPRVITHSSSTGTQGVVIATNPHVHHNETAPTASMFSVSASNPDFDVQMSKHVNHYVPLSEVSHPYTSIHEHVRYRLDNRIMSLAEAFQHLDVHNSGFITQEELLNVSIYRCRIKPLSCALQACWYWGVHITAKDFKLLREAYPPNLVR
jgi:hypothetical protein